MLDDGSLPDAALYGFDIETDTTLDGLDPTRSAVVAVAVSGPAVAEVLDAASAAPEDERDLLLRTDELLSGLPPGVLVTWNGRAFDLPFLHRRAQHLGVTTGLRMDERTGEAAWHEHRHLDGLRAYRADVGRTFGLSCGLKALSRLVGMEPVEVDRRRIHDLGPEELHEYVLSDARLARALVERRWPGLVGWVDRAPGPAGFD